MSKVAHGAIEADNGGLRYNEGKARFDLIPPEALEALAAHYARGALKYADRNWERGMDWTRGCFASMERHAWAWMRGEDCDPETGTHHMIAVAWNAFALFTYAQRGIGADDRPKVDPMRTEYDEQGGMPALADPFTTFLIEEEFGRAPVKESERQKESATNLFYKDGTIKIRAKARPRVRGFDIGDRVLIKSSKQKGAVTSVSENGGIYVRVDNTSHKLCYFEDEIIHLAEEAPPDLKLDDLVEFRHALDDWERGTLVHISNDLLTVADESGCFWGLRHDHVRKPQVATADQVSA